MSVEAATQIVTLVLAVLAIIWHQQRTTDKLRDEFNTAINGLRDEFNTAFNGLRDEFNTAINGLRDEFNTAINGLRDAVIGNGQRIARIEGFLKIGMPASADAPDPAAAEPAPGA